MSSQSVTQVKKVFMDRKEPLTLSDLGKECLGIYPNQLSSALCYLMRARWVTREKRENPDNRGHKTIWVYTYHPERLPKLVSQPKTVETYPL